MTLSGMAPGPPTRIDAGAVIVRRVRVSDADAIAVALGISRQHCQPWMPRGGAASRRAQLAHVAGADSMWTSGICHVYSILTASYGTLVGQIALHQWNHSADIGYWIARTQRNRGYATAAARALTQAALALPHVRSVRIRCDAANIASAAIARRLGYRLEGTDACGSREPGESGWMLTWVRGGDDPA